MSCSVIEWMVRENRRGPWIPCCTLSAVCKVVASQQRAEGMPYAECTERRSCGTKPGSASCPAGCNLRHWRSPFWELCGLVEVCHVNVCCFAAVTNHHNPLSKNCLTKHLTGLCRLNLFIVNCFKIIIFILLASILFEHQYYLNILQIRLLLTCRLW